MKVLINAFSARLGGGQTYIINLLECLPHIGDSEIFVLAPASLKLPSDRPNIKRVYSKWPVENPFFRALWEKVYLPKLLDKLKVDVLFCPGGLIETTPPPQCKSVTMFRNMIPFDPVQRSRYRLGYMRLRNWVLEKLMLRSMLKADLVIFISEFAKKVIDRRAPNAIKRSVVIPHGISPHFRIPAEGRRSRPDWLPKEGYFLYASTIDVYKAQIEVVRGFAILKQRYGIKEKLILAGSENPHYGKMVRAEIEGLGLRDEVILAGFIPYHELPNVYQHARINIFASESENCPNILLECLASGTPVVASNFDPMPEFGGNAVVYFDPRSPEDFAEKMTSVLDNVNSMDALAKKAEERSLRYDWRNTARQTWGAIEGLHKISRPRLIIHAPNVHQGGGKSLLIPVLAELNQGIDGHVILDARLNLPFELPSSLTESRVKPSIADRLIAECKLCRLAGRDDIVLCFGNLPPLFKVKAKVFLLIQNRFLTGSATLSGFSLLTRLRIVVERVWLRWRLKRIHTVIVQTPSVQRDILDKKRISPIILPFSDKLTGYQRNRGGAEPQQTLKGDFLYVASGDPHKNHRNLIEAWALLAEEGMFPSLYLTVPQKEYSDLCAWIDNKKAQHGLKVENLGTVPQEEIQNSYKQVHALIYPSTLESLGLPLIEARCSGLPIVASELDFVRDLIDPEQSFDPHSPVSIARAVKRFLGKEEKPLPLISARAFLQQLLEMSR